MADCDTFEVWLRGPCVCGLHPPCLRLEDGGALLLEDGGRISLEDKISRITKQIQNG